MSMSILIKDMEMPKDKAIAVVIHPDGAAYTAEMFAGVCTKYLADCTAVPVPPHGDLIDRDALIQSVSADTCDCNPDHFDLDDKDGYGKWMLHNGINTGIVAARVRIKGAPTIIPAEEGE